MPFAGAKNQTFTLTIAGPEAADVPLTMWGPQPASGVTTLFTQGPEANSIPLFIGEEFQSSGNIPVYLQAPLEEASPGATALNNEISLSVSGSSYAGLDTNSTLFVSAPSIGSGIVAVPLNIATDAIPDMESGFNPASGQVTTTISGSGPTPQTGETTLFIRVEETATSGVPLYINRPLAQSMTLSIPPHGLVSGVIPVSISGAYMSTSSSTLFIKSPTSGILTTHIRGFLE